MDRRKRRAAPSNVGLVQGPLSAQTPVRCDAQSDNGTHHHAARPFPRRFHPPRPRSCRA
ncbi:hypothetical protein [Azospirillum palustre]